MIETIHLAGMLSLPVFLLLDLAYRGRPFAKPRGWRIQALLVSVAAYATSLWVAGFWGSVITVHLLDLGALGTWWGALVGVMTYQLFHYGYHRLIHKSDFLWRHLHQMHHSAESIDAYGAYYLHPLDAAMFSTLGSLVFFPLLGLTLEAGIAGGAFLAFCAIFQHANIRTPRWLGYIIQRPESHQLHHGRNVHRYNYADVPFWDMVFGTFRNPERFEGEIGFYLGASRRIPEMLIGKDVASAPTPQQEQARPTRTLARVS